MINIDRINLILVLLAALFVPLACSHAVREKLSEKEAAVYRAVIRSSQTREIAISNEAISAFGLAKPEDFRSILPSAPNQAAIDFLEKNRNQFTIENDTDIGEGLILIASRNRTEYLSQLNRLHLVSRVGFDSGGGKAIVYCFYSCQPLCGEGGFFFLEYRDSDWIIVEESEKVKT